MGLGQVATAAEISDAGVVEVLHGFAEGVMAVVTGVVVGQRQGIEAALQHGEDAWLCAKAVDLVVERVPLLAIGHSRLPMR